MKDCLVVQKGNKSGVARRKRPRNLRSREKPSAPMQSSINGGGEVVLYEAPDGQIRLDVRLEQDTVWLTQAQMAELFGRERSVVTKHINNVFGDGELAKKSNVQNLHIASSDKPVAAYSLDVIISVGYRVKSKRGVQFRQWATRVLREHLVQGYTFNQTRLAERGLLEARQTLDLLARTRQNHALGASTRRRGRSGGPTGEP